MAKTDKSQQITTLLEATGLTPQQENACILLASGESHTSVADKLGINRSTLYDWLKDTAFQCFFNRQCKDYQAEITNGIMSLHRVALDTIKQVLEEGNENTRLKAAFWVLDKVSSMQVGEVDLREAVKKECTTDWDFSIAKFDGEKFSKRMAGYGLKS